MAEEKTCELSNVIPPLVLGGGGFNDQINPDPRSLPVRSIIKAAFELGIRAFDTSPYYGPSEELIGDALSQPDITKKYSRSEYTLMTKVGRISETEFDYSPTWVEYSVRRSLQRLQTSYLDVVFCHDVEFVTEGEVIGALEVLYKLVAQGLIRYVGISGYRLDILVMLCRAARLCYGRPLDIVQCWAQLTLQNTRLLSDDEGLQALRNEGVSCICNSSPLAIGLLRSGGVPQGSQGRFPPCSHRASSSGTAGGPVGGSSRGEPLRAVVALLHLTSFACLLNQLSSEHHYRSQLYTRAQRECCSSQTGVWT
ncbi:uncharacterized protein N7477_001965 [Penicillium maclennaniae]|uniref:uncharacterized protein n=1 Tax=Penicillium maclennaniae TaxID=1343394 RepID=UPI00253FEDB4|nr:uncharacterized protein N7477_001965 [Penicillium maclennaniae]KAJ5682025.1 hypothetical protein N7477_001965 [Penicillium maclennaniae]